MSEKGTYVFMIKHFLYKLHAEFLGDSNNIGLLQHLTASCSIQH